MSNVTKKLTLVVAGEDAESDGHACVERDPQESVGGSAADVLEVRRAAPHHDAQRHHSVVAGHRESTCEHRKLEGARAAAHVGRGASIGGGTQRALDQRVGDLGMPLGGHHSDPKALGPCHSARARPGAAHSPSPSPTEVRS